MQNVSRWLVTFFAALGVCIVGQTTITVGRNVVEVVKANTPITQYTHITRYGVYNTQCLGKKRVISICPAPMDGLYAISAEDEAVYRANNISYEEIHCSVTELKTLRKLRPTTFKFIQAFFFDKPERYFKGKMTQYARKSFSLISDEKKQIDIYENRYYGNDMRWYTTPHQGRIAILVNEQGMIVRILDDVKNESDIFKAFGIQ